MNHISPSQEVVTTTTNTTQQRIIKELRKWLPHRGTVLFTMLVLGGLFWSQSVGAIPFQAPAAATVSTNTFAYQGQLADSNGNPVTGTYDMSFKLYSVAIGGSALWSEDWSGGNGIQVGDGLFNVMLGSLASIPQSVIASNANLFLGITIGGDQEMTPRVQLGSVPFATQALTVPDASITTTKIADGAVTQVTQVKNDDYVDMTSNGPLKDMSVTMTTSGKPVLILFSTRWGHDTTGQRFCYTLERNNTAVAQSCDSDGGDIWGANTALSLTWLDVPPAGTHTYRIFIQMQGGTIHFKNRQMQIVELKK